MSQSVLTFSPSASPDDLMEQGLRCHRGNQLASAQSAYRRVLEADPAHFRAHYLLGMAHAQQGEYGAAIRCFQDSLRAQPDYFDALYNLGSAYTEAGDSASAVPPLRQAIALQPEHGGARYALGNALQAGGHVAAAIESFRQAVRCQPQLAAAHNNLGNALAEQGDYANAVASLRHAASLAPGEWQIHSSLSAALHANGQLEEAVVACRRALALQPDNISLYANLAKTLWIQGKTDEARRGLDRAQTRLNERNGAAIPQVDALLTLGGAYQALCEYTKAAACFRQALDIAPDCAEAQDRLGQTCYMLESLEEAEACFRKALELRPDCVGARVRLSHILSACNRLEEAEALTRQALELRGDDADARRSLGQLLLKQGDYAQGWPHYDHIHRIDIHSPRRFAQPRWDGSDLSGKTILIHAQFGLGDTMQFARYLPLVKARGGRVLFECPWELATLLQRNAGFDKMLVRTPACGNRVPDAAFDTQFNLMSLAALFQSDEATIPSVFPYIHADAAHCEQWRGRMEAIRGENNFVIGIVWAASTEGLRSCRAQDFAPLACLPGVELVSLQKGLEARQAGGLPSEMRLHNVASDIGDFADTAAVLAHLDLVITVDTSVTHLAGAMNIPVWTLLPYGADWRWQRERADTPWYPSMRLFRQTWPGDWASVFAQVAPALQQLLSCAAVAKGR